LSTFQVHCIPADNCGNGVVLRLSGALDLASLVPLESAFEALAADRTCLVVCDFENVDFVSSPAVGVLMGGRRRMQECGGDLVLASLGGGLLEKMQLMGANRVFRFYPDTASAFREFKWEHQDQTDNISLELPARAVYVPALRRIVSGMLQQKGYSNKEAFRIETIVDELANNAI